MRTDTREQYVDPEPWIHRWPNDRSGTRSAVEKCTVSECKATFEPRTGNELQRLLKEKSTRKTWLTTVVSWFQELSQRIRR